MSDTHEEVSGVAEAEEVAEGEEVSETEEVAEAEKVSEAEEVAEPVEEPRAIKRHHDDSDDEKIPAKKSTADAARIQEHYNKIEDKGLSHRKESNIYYMRNMNNWIKSIFIKTYALKLKKKHGDSFRALDLCCGKGGDLLKWTDRDINLTELIGVDIADQSIEDCKERHKNLRYSRIKGHFFSADCGAVRIRSKFPDPSVQFDMVSCQFAFHYAFENLARAELFFQNASECLKPGGYFIGTIPNSNRIIDMARKSDSDNFGNSVFNIKWDFDPNGEIPLFGAKYNFHLEGVVDCPEYLVHFPTLVKLAEKYDLELVMNKCFDEFVEEHKKSHAFLIHKIKAMEVYRPESMTHSDDQFEHIKNYMKDNPKHSNRLKTLSKCEWDVICLYRLFAFKKIKKT